MNSPSHPLFSRTIIASLAFLFMWGCGGSSTGSTDVYNANDTMKDALDMVSDGHQDAEPSDVAQDALDATDELYMPWDLPDDFEISVFAPDVQVDPPDTFSDCPNLGVSDTWAGTFDGYVTYSLDTDDSGTPSEGLFLVGGDLNFEIKCIESKWVMVGDLNGVAFAAGEVGEHPFGAKLLGDFDPFTRTVYAQLLEGEVRLFSVISVYFEGNFTGTVDEDGVFGGQWDAEHTGNDLGYEGVSEGWGTWTANPVF